VDVLGSIGYAAGHGKPVYHRVYKSGIGLVWFKAPALGAGDRRFESYIPDHFLKRVYHV
jgi:hypothetical protein